MITTFKLRRISLNINIILVNAPIAEKNQYKKKPSLVERCKITDITKHRGVTIIIFNFKMKIKKKIKELYYVKWVK